LSLAPFLYRVNIPRSSESDSDVPEAISLKIARNLRKRKTSSCKIAIPSTFLFLSSSFQLCGASFRGLDICVNFLWVVESITTHAKDKNRARDARLKAAQEEATKNRSTESGPSSAKHGGGKKGRSIRRRRPVALLFLRTTVTMRSKSTCGQRGRGRRRPDIEEDTSANGSRYA